MEWRELKRYHLNPPTHIFPRTLQVQYDYEQYKLNNPNYHKLLQDRLFINNDITIEFNSFPYHIKEGYHLVVWINKNIKFDIKDLIHILEYLDIKEYVIFENLPYQRSVPSIRHFHLFLKHYTDVTKILNTPVN